MASRDLAAAEKMYMQGREAESRALIQKIFNESPAVRKMLERMQKLLLGLVAEIKEGWALSVELEKLTRELHRMSGVDGPV